MHATPQIPFHQNQFDALASNPQFPFHQNQLCMHASNQMNTTPQCRGMCMSPDPLRQMRNLLQGDFETNR